MRSLNTYLITVLAVVLFNSCRKPKACIEISNLEPKFCETITLDGNCSDRTRWIEYFVDDVLVGGGTGPVQYHCGKPGIHTIKMVAFRGKSGNANSRTQCTNCTGTGKTSTIIKTINVSDDITIQTNSPIDHDQTLTLTASQLGNASYYWVGPNNSTYEGRELNILHANKGHAGTYSVTAKYNGISSKTATVHVTLNQLNTVCDPPINQCSFTGGLTTTTVGGLSYGVINDQMQFYASSNSLNLSFKFNDSILPYEGIYTLNGNPYSLEFNEVYMEVKPTNFISNTVVGNGVVYVKLINGKYSFVFCGIPFTYMQNNFSITGKINEP